MLDPVLALSPYGIQLVRQLGKALELWIAREFWPFTQQQTLWATLDGNSESLPPDLIRTGAKAWRTLQNHLSPADLPLYWYGDRLWESHLPQSHSAAQFYHWEILAESLESLLPMPMWDTPLLRDTLALAVTLSQGFVLTYQPQVEQPPSLCKLMEAVKLPCHRLTDDDTLLQLHRQELRRLLLNTGLAPLQWGQGRLAILQLGVQDAITLPALLTKQYNSPSGIDRLALERTTNESRSLAVPWQANTGFWFSL